MASRVHNPHPLWHESERVLYDDCPACMENAGWPMAGLDTGSLRELWRTMLAVEFGDASYPTRPEMTVGRNLYYAAVLVGRLGLMKEGWQECELTD